jgi:hypothetical protein
VLWLTVIPFLNLIVTSASHCEVEARDGDGECETLLWPVEARDTRDVARDDDDDCVRAARRWGRAMTNGMRLAVLLATRALLPESGRARWWWEGKGRGRACG